MGNRVTRFTNPPSNHSDSSGNSSSLVRELIRRARKLRKRSRNSRLDPSTGTAVSDVQFEWLQGRRHVSGAVYMLPNDMTEIDRLDQQHYMLRAMWNGNYLAKLKPETMIDAIDVGTGTGIWVLEMAKEFPNCQFIGCDLSPVQPQDTRPRNTSFMVADVLKGLPFPDESFDYIHARLLVLGVPVANWPLVIQEYYRLLKPNGTLELCECTGHHYHAGPNGARINSWLMNLCKQRGIDMNIMAILGHMMKSVGFVNIKEWHWIAPTGSWAGRVGELERINFVNLLYGFRGLIIKLGLVDKEGNEFDEIIQGFVDEVDRERSYQEFPIFVGRKPSEDEEVVRMDYSSSKKPFLDIGRRVPENDNLEHGLDVITEQEEGEEASLLV